jgi:hypothetical protein
LAHLRDSRFRDRGLITERIGQGSLHITHRQPAHERGYHQRFQRIGLGDVLAEQARGERGGRAAQLGPLQGDWAGGGLDCRWPIAIARPGLRIRRGGAPLVAIAAQELGYLGLQCGLHQQLRTQPGHLLKDLGQLTIRGEQLVDLGANTIGRRYSCRHGRRSFHFDDLAVSKQNLRPAPFTPALGRDLERPSGHLAAEE